MNGHCLTIMGGTPMPRGTGVPPVDFQIIKMHSSHSK
jgi:hypothetical protein